MKPFSAIWRADATRENMQSAGRSAAALSSPPELAPYLSEWRSLPKNRKKRKEIPRGRHAPRPHARSSRRRQTCSPICSIRRSKKAPRGSARPPGCSRRRIIRSTAARIFRPPTRRASRRPNWRQRVSRKRRSATTPPRRSPGSIPNWRKNWALATMTTPLPPLPACGERVGVSRRLGQSKAAIPPHPTRCARRPLPARRGEVKRKYRLPRADLPQPGSGLSSMGVAATAAGAGEFAARGPQGIRRPAPWMPHRPPRPEKSEGGKRLVIQSDFEPKGDQPAGDQRTGRRRQAQRPHASSSWRHRLGQNLHHGQGDRGDAAPRAHPGAEQNLGGAALRRVQVVLPRQRGGIFRLAITTTTSRRPTSRAPTPTSRRNPRSTSRSTACATRPRARCSSATT